MDAAASVVGIVSFGLSLAKTLQAFIDSVIEAEETITLIVAEVNHTASTLKRLQDFIDEDKTTSQEEHRPTVFNVTGVQEVGACALQCQKIYFQIIFLIEKASMQVGEDGSKNTTSQPPPAEDPDAPAIRLAVFSKNVTKFGRKMRWPWLEPRIKRCQEHLGRLKVSLMLSLQVFLIAESRARPSVARIFGTDEEGDLRDRAEMLRKKMTELRAKKNPPKQSSTQPPGSDDGTSEVIDIASGASTVSTTSVISSSTTGSRNSSSYATSSSSGSEQGHRSRRSRRSRISRAARVLHVFKVHFRKRLERKAVFKKDSKSVIYEAYLIYPVPGPLPGDNSPPPSMKLPFGHRRLTREVKRALRKCNPWEILLALSPHHRFLVDKVAQQVQLAATGISNVCLVAIDVDGYDDAEISGLEVGDLVWTRMVLFFHHEILSVPKKNTEKGTEMNGGRPRFGATIHDILTSGQRKSKQRLEFQARLKREEEEKLNQEAKNKADKENFEKDKAELEEAKKILQAQQIRIEEEKNDVEDRHRKLKEAEEVALKEIEKGTSEGEMKKIAEEAKMSAKSKPPLKFRDAIGRKFNFPFNLVQTWEGMEDLIKQAFIHVDLVGSRVQEGHYDLISSEGEIILPSLWSATVKPGDSVSMRMWPERAASRPPQPPFPFPGGPMQGMAPTTDINHTLGRVPGGMASYPGPSGMPPPIRFGGGHSGPMRPPGWPQGPPPPPGGRATRPFTVDIGEGGRPKKSKTRRAKTTQGFFSGTKPSKKSGKGKHQHSKHKIAESRGDEESEDTDKGDDVGEIDKELGLDDLEGAERVAGKDIDELLETWTNVAGETAESGLV